MSWGGGPGGKGGCVFDVVLRGGGSSVSGGLVLEVVCVGVVLAVKVVGWSPLLSECLGWTWR